MQTKYIGEQETLNSFLVCYRDTPHISTGISPGTTIFRDGYKTDFPRKKVSQKKVNEARWRDINSKNERKDNYNSARHIKKSTIKVGDYVLVRNYIRN